MVSFFKQEHELDINITAVTSDATRVSERLMNTILEDCKGSLKKQDLYFSTPKEENT